MNLLEQFKGTINFMLLCFYKTFYVKDYRYNDVISHTLKVARIALASLLTTTRF